MEKSVNTICPPTLWAQTKDRILLTFLVQDTKDLEVKFEANRVVFKANGGTGNQCYMADIQLLKEIDPDQSKWDRTSRLVTVIAMKKEIGPFWPRLLETKLKQHWLKVDFDKMRDSDESSEDEAPAMGQPDLSQMMAQMGRGTGSANFDDLEEDEDDDSLDSDDEEIPGLETAETAEQEVSQNPAEETVGQA